jgi:concanavalin A-like lectin/glucanase superfamily protein
VGVITMKKLIIIFLAFISLNQCQKQSIEPISLNESGEISLSLDLTSAPAEVTTISGYLSRANYDTIFFDFSISGTSTASAFVENIIPGRWDLTINAFNDEGFIIYTGSTELDINPGIVTSVSLQLNPTTGSLEIIVTWGTSTFNDSSMVLYYPFNGNANDESFYGNHGLITGATLTTDRFENVDAAYEFDGDFDFIETNTTYDFQNRSVSFWTLVYDISSERQIIDQDDISLDYGAFSASFKIDSSLYGNCGGEGPQLIEENPFLYQWYHIVLIRNASSTNIYVNGTLSHTGTPSGNGNSVQPNDDLVIGTYRAMDGQFFYGKIDDIVIYNRILSSTEIDSLYHDNGW